MRRIVAAVILAIAALSAEDSVALTSTGTNCQTTSFTVGLTVSTASPVDKCEGIFSGNDDNQITATTSLFNKTGWTKLVKLDDDEGTATENGITLNVDATLNAGPDALEGTWSVTSWGGYSHVMAVLKGGPSFSAFLVDVTSGTAGTWNTLSNLTGGNNPKRGPGLSHFTFYKTGSAIPINPVPLPAAAWLLLAGVGSFGAMRLRRRSAA